MTPTGLIPDTEYEYRVQGTAGSWSDVRSTRTAPASGPASFDAVFVADTGLIGRTDGLASGTAQVRDEIAALDPRLVLGGGDYAYYNTETRFATLDEAIGDSFIGGVVYRGLIVGRDEDVLGAGVAWAELFQGGSNEETVYEFFYKAQITPSVSLQPDIQYIVTPSGIHPDALAVGIRFQIALQ